jgi:putative ABC transport system ATP-binding protein
LIFFGFPLLLFPIWFLSKRVKKIARDIQKNQEKFTSVLIDFIGGVQTVKLFAEESFSLHKYRELNQKMGFLEQKSAKYDLLSRPIVHTIAMFFLVMALIFGLYVLEMPVADVLFFCGMLYLFYEPIKKFAEENSHIQRGIAAAERMEEVICLPVEAKKEEGTAEFSKLEKDIEFKNVWFKYNEEWVLKNLSFTIKKGELVALVGATGAGKSTVAQLLPRLWDYQKGDILIDGKSLLTFTQESLRRHIAYVPQKSFLFLDTIKENIRFGGRFSDQEVVEAAKQAHSHEFIEKLPKGYDTYLSEGGKNLSGGQQQRLTIARALIKKSPLLIMDEATSSLDALSEHYIKETIQNLKNEVTQIVIAHRLSTIENADKILFLEKGELVAQGTKDELLKTCPPFKRLWDLLLLNNNN